MNRETDTRYTFERELSWLKFNERVLEEAEDESNPLMERMKFVEIFSNNLREFFEVRVGRLTDLVLLKDDTPDNKTGRTPGQRLEGIFAACIPLYKRRDKAMQKIEGRLRTCNICRLEMNELDNKARKQVEAWFRTIALPVLSPQLIGVHHPFPHLPDNSQTVILKVRKKNGRDAYAVIPVPGELPPFVVIESSGMHYVLTEDIILAMADEAFRGIQITDRAVFSITRNADIRPEDDVFDSEEDFRQIMRKVLKKRKRLAPVRIEIRNLQNDKWASVLSRLTGLPENQIFRSSMPLKLSYIYQIIDKLPEESRQIHCFREFKPGYPPCIDPKQKLIPQISSKDVLFFYPYQSMDPFVQLVREAANDPDVISIRITIYRLASRAKIPEYLCAAAENGKEVTVLMELKARFDEQNNIHWADMMEESGCNIMYGADNIKVHSKICVITRRDENGELQYITQVGTGNYNEKTAKIYTDLSLMTGSKVFGEDANELFRNLAMENFDGSYEKLLASPFRMRDRIFGLIDREITKGSEGYIFFKVNSLTDRTIIDKLAEASQAGVRVVMNIRGICCLRPGVEGLTDNITVYSIVGRFLEHARIYRFGSGDDADLFISSADLMTRNMERRVEIACPVEDFETRRMLLDIIDSFNADNVKARYLGADGVYRRKAPGAAEGRVSVQELMMNKEFDYCMDREAGAGADTAGADAADVGSVSGGSTEHSEPEDKPRASFGSRIRYLTGGLRRRLMRR